MPIDDFLFYTRSFTTGRCIKKHSTAVSCPLEISIGEGKNYDYSLECCILGNACVSVAKSTGGWAHESNSEIDGLMLIIPTAGSVTWGLSKERLKAVGSGVIVIDHPEIRSAQYSQNAEYTSIFFDYLDIYKHLSLQLGREPGSRVFFTQETASLSVTRFLQELVGTINGFFKAGDVSDGRVLSCLKEALVCYVLYNIENSFTSILKGPALCEPPTPYHIQKVVDYIDSNFNRFISLADMALYAGVGVRALQVGFKKYKKLTPMQYLREVRHIKC